MIRKWCSEFPYGRFNPSKNDIESSECSIQVVAPETLEKSRHDVGQSETKNARDRRSHGHITCLSGFDFL